MTKQFNTQFTNDPYYADPIDFKLYKQHNLWVFDDDRVGLIAEAFVMGMDKIIDQLKAKAGIEHDNITLMMQDGEMCQADAFVVAMCHDETKIHRLLGKSHYYRIETEGIEGITTEKGHNRAWLCPNIHRYYNTAPKSLALWIVESN